VTSRPAAEIACRTEAGSGAAAISVLSERTLSDASAIDAIGDDETDHDRQLGPRRQPAPSPSRRTPAERAVAASGRPRFLGRSQPYPDAPHRVQVAGFLRGLAKLSAQPGQMDVEALIGPPGVRTKQLWPQRQPIIIPAVIPDRADCLMP